ncbi:hypothetical protein H3M12_12285 (plasmid) [Levilactobacillus suantsaii]|uniref:hypothetical protein n=1 Tax=Levilactobacillus suantsaii TaxID=2292255 RepID=UPI0015F5A338|nr:hypothetical protein [Levilactobacillus suantsaii]QMU09281.1 hypothetical protein H3M12_12285 [Levilactobacillus suantsaii]
MRSSFAKSIYLGAAVLGLAGLSAVTTTTASAKSYATAGAYSKLTTDATKRNVEATGTHALYTKPGTVKGAKIVASKATMAKLASSKKSADYFRAYGVKTTNRGSVYYRVVTMDQKYRGYVYGGKVADTFGGGIKAAETTTANTTDSTIGKTVTFTNPGTKHVTWTAPKYTQYKSGASKVVKNTTPFAGDTLKVTKAETKTREGSLYYYVEDQQNPTVNGWIYSKAVTTDASAAYNQASDVKVNFVNPNGTLIAKAPLRNLIENNTDNTGVSKSAVAAHAKGTQVGFDAQKKANNAWGKAALTGTGYVYSSKTASNMSALLGAKTGDTITLTVTKGTQVVQGVSAYYQKGTSITKLVAKSDDSKVDLNYQVTFPTLGSAFAGSKGATYTAADVQNFLTANKADTLNSANYAKDAGGDVVKTSDPSAIGAKGTAIGKQPSTDNPVVVYHTTYTLTSGVAGTYTDGGNASAFYNTAKEVKGSANTTNTGHVSAFS